MCVYSCQEIGFVSVNSFTYRIDCLVVFLVSNLLVTSANVGAIFGISQFRNHSEFCIDSWNFIGKKENFQAAKIITIEMTTEQTVDGCLGEQLF